MLHVQHTLGRLLPHHRAALVLRYVDGLPVPEVATLLERSVHATESLLVRAKAAYRQAAADLHPEGGPLMTDAFDALRADISPIAPSPAFAAHLRDRLTDTLTRQEPTMSTPPHHPARRTTRP